MVAAVAWLMHLVGLSAALGTFIAGVVVALYSQAGRRFAPWLTMTWLLLPQIMIAWMISRTEGVESPYYVGLNLAIFASGIALPFGLWQNLVFGILSYVLYAAACLLHPGGIEPMGTFIVNSLFLLFAAAASGRGRAGRLPQAGCRRCSTPGFPPAIRSGKASPSPLSRN